MVKDAVQATKAVISENKGYRQTAPTAAQRGNTISGLRDEAASFANVQQRVKKDEKSYSGKRRISLKSLMPNTHRRRRRDSTVESSRVASAV